MHISITLFLKQEKQTFNDRSMVATFMAKQLYGLATLLTMLIILPVYQVKYLLHIA